MRRGRPPFPGLLTPREQEVLALLQQGLTNEEIAKRLDITERGARYHVSEILSKLGVQSRHQAATWQHAGSGSRFFGVAFIAALWRRLPVEQVMKLTTGAVLAAAVIAAIFIAIGIAVMESRSGGEEEAAVSVENEAVEEPTPPPAATQAPVATGFTRQVFGWGEQVQYEVPGMDDVIVREDLTFKTVGELVMNLDLYLPADIGEGEQLPVVVIVPGGRRYSLLRGQDVDHMIGKDVKNRDQYTAYARMLASSGLAAVVFNHRHEGESIHAAKLEDMEAVVEDTLDLLAYVRENAVSLNVDSSKLCVWDWTAPFGVVAAMRDEGGVSCLVVYYGPMDLRGLVSAPEDGDLEPLSPITLVSADWPATFVVEAFDTFVPVDDFISEAQANGVEIEVTSSPYGAEFDLFCGNQGLIGGGECDDRGLTGRIKSAIKFIIDHVEG